MKSAPLFSPKLGSLWIWTLTVTLLCSPAAWAGGDSRASFNSESSGLPLGTFSGTWVHQGSESTLLFHGVSSPAARTCFRAEWASSPTKQKFLHSLLNLKSESASNAPITLRLKVRVRPPGEVPSRWLAQRRFDIDPGLSEVSHIILVYPVMTPKQIIFEWRLVGCSDGIARLSGRAEVGVT